jgi:hypothetical protein
MKQIIFSTLILITVFSGFTSCTDTLPEEVVAFDDYYKNLDDADAAVLGLYGKFMELAEQVVVLNELKADLMDVTPNASTDLEEINLNRPSKDNAYANVSKFYGVIQSCNDILHNYDVMLAENRLIQDEYNEKYSDVAALRCWVYLQLSNLFGKVPYITDPIIALDDLEQYRGNDLSPDLLIKELIKVMENLPTLENYKLSKLISGTIDGYSLKPFFINKKCMLGDLYLYADDYENAARLYREVLKVGEDLPATDRNCYRTNRLYSYAWTSGTPDWFAVLYSYRREEDSETFYNAWRNMFIATTTGRSILEEHFWFFAYDAKFAPEYTLSRLFDPVGLNGGAYFLKPSDYAVESVWGGEVQSNGFPFDARGYTGAFDTSGDNHYIMKYSYATDFGNWFLYRAAMLHLRYAEAANRAGYPKLAWALVNDGIGGAAFNWKREDGTTCRGDSIRYSSYGPGEPYPDPYYIDARYSSSPYVISAWRDGHGVRGRANLPNTDFPETAVTTRDSILFMEKFIIREAALELGFEGHRWGDLVRIARRLNKENQGEGTRFLFDENIAKKYQHSGIPAPDMSSEEKWYLPLFE